MVRMVGMVMMTNCGRQTLQLGPSHSALTHTWAAPCNDDDEAMMMAMVMMAIMMAIMVMMAGDDDVGDEEEEDEK